MTDTETAPAAENTAEEQKKPETKRERISVKHVFTQTERIDIGEKWAAGTRDLQNVEDEFASVKADFKSRLERIDLDNGALCRKFSDGFEMREKECIVTFNDPSKGRKTYRLEEGGEVVREESMSACDYERELPLTGEEPSKPDGKKDEHDADAILNMAGAEEAGLTGDEATSAVSSPGAEDAGETALGEVLDAATAKTKQPLVELNLDQPGWTAPGLILEFKMKAKDAGWPVTAHCGHAQRRD
jgi:hypothetical protein